jgi:predicted dehydrogenase
MLAAPAVIKATALGGNGRPAASERVVTAYIGTGPRGILNIQEQLSCPQAQVVAVCDVWKHARESARRIVNTYYGNSDCKVYVDFRDILARPDIDAVSIASPDHWHVPMTVLAAKAGKDVCVEKPLGVSVAEDQLCRSVIQRYGRVFAYGTEARASPTCRLGAEMVRNGRIGRIREIRVKAPNSSRGGSRIPRPLPQNLNYDLWLGPAPWRPYSGCPDNGDSWYHDLLQWAFDTHLQGTWEVEGTGIIPGEGCNDTVMDWDVRIRFASGVTMNYWATGVKKPEHPRLANLGDYAQVIGEDGWVALYYASMICDPLSLQQAAAGPRDIHLPISQGQERNFIECVRTRQRPVSNLEDAVHSDLISHVSDIAIRSGRKLTWDPVKEEFIGDPEATRRLSRATREPWYWW